MSLPKILLLSVSIISLLCPKVSSAEEIVVLLHGIANVPLSMSYLQNGIEKAGYRAYNLDYPSTDESIEKASHRVASRIRELAGGSTVNFVAHSMGNLVVRVMAGTGTIRMGRIVMIAPPNQGSYAAERLKNLNIYRWFFGPAGEELSADNRTFFDNLPIPDCEFGIIAGGRGDGEGYNPLLDGDDDGTVRVEETRLKGAADFTLVKNTHTLLLFDRETLEQTISFLKTGRFQKLKEEGGRKKEE